MQKEENRKAIAKKTLREVKDDLSLSTKNPRFRGLKLQVFSAPDT
jgi:hypothetical protein